MCVQIANAERLAMDAMAAALTPPPPLDFNRWAE